MVSCALSRSAATPKLALTFDYGQRAAKKEILTAGLLTRMWGVEHRVIPLPWLAGNTKTALVNKAQKLPHFVATDEALNNSINTTASAAAVWVPNRNGLFINIAACFAEMLQADLIVTGFNAEEAATFPDNSEAFLKAASASLAYSTKQQCRVESYTKEMQKFQIIEKALQLDLPINTCWPCYESFDLWCGECESCARFKRALPENLRSTFSKQFIIG